MSTATSISFCWAKSFGASAARRWPNTPTNKIFAPLGMNDTHVPAAGAPEVRASRRPRSIEDTGQPLRGVVHDETSRFMGGIAGHAGLFTTAADLSRFAQMMLGLGTWVDPATGKEVQIFSPLTIRKFTEPGSPADQAVIRALGWDVDSPYSSNRGELFPIGSYGHTGFTGTSIWMDPSTQTYVIVLTNVVHPKRGKSLSSFRSRLATIVAASLGVNVPGVTLTGYNETMPSAGIHRVVNRNAETLTGLDVMEADQFAALRGKRIGLITNHTGLDRSGRRNVDVMLAGGTQGDHAVLAGTWLSVAPKTLTVVANGRIPQTGLPVVSLYRRTSGALPRISARRRCSGFRYSGCRRSLLYLLLHDALRSGRSRQNENAVLRPGPAQSDHRDAHSKGRYSTRALYSLRRLLRHADAPWPDIRRTGHHGQCRTALERRPARRENEGTGNGATGSTPPA